MKKMAGKLVPQGVPNKNKGACINKSGAGSGPVPLFHDSFLYFPRTPPWMQSSAHHAGKGLGRGEGPR